MAKELSDMLKKDLVKMVEKLQKKNVKLSEDIKQVDKLKSKIAELREENKYLAMQQEDDVEDVTAPVTATKPTQKKFSDMNEFELADFMRKTTSKKKF